MASLLDDIAKTIRDSVDTVVEKTEEFTKIGKIKVEIVNLKRQIEKNFSELGTQVYELINSSKKSPIASNKKVKEIIEQLKKIETQLDSKKAELEKVKNKESAQEEAEEVA